MIYLIVGRPGEGKGMYAAWLARKMMKRGRSVYADYFLEGARPWLSWEDAATPAFRGAAFFGDEVGSTFNSRATLQLDPIVFAAATMHRKVQTDLYLTAQHLGFIDIQFRRLCHAVTMVKRFGPGGEAAIYRRQRPWFWQRPWWFDAATYLIEDYDETSELKPGAEPLYQQRVWYSRELAAMYDTTQVLIPPSLRERWAELCRTGERRAKLPRMRRGRDVPASALHDVHLPIRLDAKQASREGVAVGVDDVVFSRGFYSDGQLFDVPLIGEVQNGGNGNGSSEGRSGSALTGV